MANYGNRIIKVNKQSLINRIKENKENHIKEYKKAVIAYKKEALKQLAELTKKVKDGQLKISLNLVSPIDNTKHYDNVIQMFDWDVNDEVDLTQNEFNEYIQDQTEFARQAKFSNSSYLG